MPRLEETIQVANKKGLHARPAAMLVQLANKFNSQLTVYHGSQHVNGKSIMGILTLGANCGAALKLIVEGDDAQAAMTALTAMLAKQEEEYQV